MNVSIGRRGWTGINIQSAFGVPAAPVDYIPWDTNTIHGMADQMPVTDAHGIRDSNFNSVAGKQNSEGQFKMLLDNRFVGYLLASALGTLASSSPAGGVQQHYISENQSNVPLFLSIINNRVVDQEYYPNVAVSSLDLLVAIDLATVDCKVVGDFPYTTTSGNFATTSGNIMSFKNVLFGVGSSVGNALGSLFKTTSVKLSITNGTEALWAHGGQRPYAIAHKDLKVTAEIELYFENTTDKTNYYNQAKKAAVLQFNGNPLGNGYNEQLTISLYQITLKTFEINTGVDTFQAEKIMLSGEYSVPDGKTIDALLFNSDANY